ncbi:MAG: type II 3-dehydroquinate dehydratase, partial [Flavobacteriaceae bacterium]|nr:type II 3-dehydroquinate dehydratase [Flavobacteriaceae bacterium]
DYRHKSFISPVAKGIIAGFGLNSYRLGVESIIKSFKDV